MIVFNNVTKRFKNGNLGLKDVSFSINKGEFVFLTGPSGAGKTTISRLLLREILPTQGRIFVDSKEIANLKRKKIPYLRRKISVVFQDYKLFFDKTAFENLSVPLQIKGEKKAQIKEKIEQILALVGLEGKGGLFPAQLSGGELQRVVIGRALIGGPKILFADEPTGNLDKDTSWGIIDLLKRINKEGTTVVVSTHDQQIVDTFSHRVIILEKGKIKEDRKEKEETEKPFKDKKKKEAKDKKKPGKKRGKKRKKPAKKTSSGQKDLVAEILAEEAKEKK